MSAALRSSPWAARCCRSGRRRTVRSHRIARRGRRSPRRRGPRARSCPAGRSPPSIETANPPWACQASGSLQHRRGVRVAEDDAGALCGPPPPRAPRRGPCAAGGSGRPGSRRGPRRRRARGPRRRARTARAARATRRPRASTTIAAIMANTAMRNCSDVLEDREPADPLPRCPRDVAGAQGEHDAGQGGDRGHAATTRSRHRHTAEHQRGEEQPPAEQLQLDDGRPGVPREPGEPAGDQVRPEEVQERRAPGVRVEGRVPRCSP